MPGNAKVNGTWKELVGVSAKVNGSWKEVAEGYTKVNGTWEQWLVGVKPTYELIATVTPNNVSSFTIDNIDQDYTHLFYDASYVSDQNGTFNQPNFKFFVNNVTTSDYGQMAIGLGEEAQNTTGVAGSGFVQATIQNSASFGAPGALTVVRGVLPFYSKSDRKKVAYFDNYGYAGVFAISNTRKRILTLNTNNPVTSITFSMNNTSHRFVTDTQVKLYGVKS